MLGRCYTISVFLALGLFPPRLMASDATTHGRPDQGSVLIVTSSAVAAFEQGLKGIEQGLGPAARVTIVDLAAKPEALAAVRAGDARLVIAVGNNALDWARRLGNVPVLATMVLQSDLPGPNQNPPAGAVVLDLPLRDILAPMMAVLPGKTRAAVIRNPRNGAPQIALTTDARNVGAVLSVIDCPQADRLLTALRSLKGVVDFVICPPDASLFNGTTVRPLIMASLENRLPVIGFSENFARTGALAAVYPDYFDVGLQTGEAAKRYLSGGNLPSSETPRKTKLAINSRVARLLGIRVEAPASAGIVVIE